MKVFARAATLGIGLWAAVCIAGPAPLRASALEFKLDFTGEQGSRAVVQEYYADLLNEVTAGDPDQPVRIGIGVDTSNARTEAIPSPIIAYFDHPALCDAEGCKLVFLYHSENDNRWIEYFDGKSNQGWIMYFSTGFVWCVEMNGGIQTLTPGDDGFIVEVGDTC